MKKIFLVCIFTLGFHRLVFSATWPNVKPKLVVFIVIDQFRADYLSRFSSQFSDEGFKALMKNGAYYPYGEYDILQSMTAPGHATVLTGAYPYQMGIPLNDWYNQTKKKNEYCVEDSDYKIIGATKENGVSPKNLVGTTVGDELKNIDSKARVFSLALKDRAAVLMGGHRANYAIWFGLNGWTSSEYYFKDQKLPNWVIDLNKDEKIKSCHQKDVCGIEMTVDAFEKLMESEKLGQTESTDLISMSFSSHDFAGHTYGPNADEMQVMTLAEDKAIARLQKSIASKVPGGLKNVLFVLTGDHGVAPSPEYLKLTGIASGQIDEAKLAKEFEDIIIKKCGKTKSGAWILDVTDFNFYINEASIAQSKCNLVQVENIIKIKLLEKSEFAQVFTEDDYKNKKLPPGQFQRQIEKTFYRGRSGHVVGIQKPFYINLSRNKASHMTGYTYDRMVPILFSGFGIRQGVFSDKTEVVDIAPTLSFILGILPPALSEGKVLKSALQ